MARGGNDATLDAFSAVLRAANNLSKDSNSSEDISDQLTPAMLVGAVKLASLSSEHQDKQTPTNANQAANLAKPKAEQNKQPNPGFNSESLATALKVAIHGLPSEAGKSTAAEDAVSPNAPSASMKSASSSASNRHEHGSSASSKIQASTIRPTKKP